MVCKQADGLGGLGPVRIHANHYTAATAAWGTTPARLGDAGFPAFDGPRIAMDKRGKATVVWTKYEAGKTNIYASRFE